MAVKEKLTADESVDLHLHSRHSDDGEFAPEELVRMAAAAGLKRIALCDHNTADGVDAFLAAARAHTIDALAGIEIDCRLHGTALHLLGYGIDHTDKRFAALRDDVAAKNAAAAPVRIAAVRALGIILDDTPFATGEAIAEAALAHPANADHPLLRPFRPGGARSDNPFVNFYWDFCAQGKPAHAPVEYMPLAEAVRLVTDTGGIPVLAHPGQNLRGKEHLLDAVIAAGVQGIEARSSYHSAADAAYWIAEAARRNLFVTRGSDFHGKTKPAIRLRRS